ncbi:hypothetical protein [Francisella uliginis]|uniref:Uncharacterized protein n=1 Tax=Francisella uliginis TaxID=573570 RepID=A0A1L4BUU8_9GAMM|nr:hypothetical protein [Francisella uliginis]API87621.1 hypothetical protein F7310_09755 [Francisella uliginis]
MKIRNNDNGTALVLAIVIAIIFLSMGYLVYSLTSYNLLLAQQENQSLQDRIAFHQQFVSTVSGSTLTYNSNIPPSGSTAIPNNHTTGAENARFDSFIIPEPGTAMRTIDYYMNVVSGQIAKTVQIKVPSNRQSSADRGLNKTSLALNIPAINFDNLQPQHFNSGSGELTDDRIGYIGDVSIDSNSEVLTLSRPGFADATLDVSNELTDGGSYALSQGWRLNDGNWEVSLGVYDTSSNSASGCLIMTSLDDFTTNFSAQSCIPIAESLTMPDYTYTDCFGTFPILDKYSVCSSGNQYSAGDRCRENDTIYQAQSDTSDTPSRDSVSWRIYYANSDWIQKYDGRAEYQIGDKVLFNDMRFVRISSPGQNRISPFHRQNGDAWRVDDIYLWNDRITYQADDIVIFDYKFYRARRGSQGSQPPNFFDWINLGFHNDNKTALDHLNTCYTTVTPTQDYINCFGVYPAVDGNEICSSSSDYNQGDQCIFEGALLEKWSWLGAWPGANVNWWRTVYPRSNWVMPYSQDLRYDIGDKVIWRNKRFELVSNTGAGTNPGTTSSSGRVVWRVDDIYEWDPNVYSYLEGDIVIHNKGIFYEARRDTMGEEPKRNPLAFDRWRRIGKDFNGSKSKDFLGACDDVVPYTEETNSLLPILGPDVNFLNLGYELSFNALDLDPGNPVAGYSLDDGVYGLVDRYDGRRQEAIMKTNRETSEEYLLTRNTRTPDNWTYYTVKRNIFGIVTLTQNASVSNQFLDVNFDTVDFNSGELL